jgi:hypothetical protein
MGQISGRTVAGNWPFLATTSPGLRTTVQPGARSRQQQRHSPRQARRVLPGRRCAVPHPARSEGRPSAPAGRSCSAGGDHRQADGAATTSTIATAAQLRWRIRADSSRCRFRSRGAVCSASLDGRSLAPWTTRSSRLATETCSRRAVAAHGTRWRKWRCSVCLIATATPRELPPIARARRAYAPDATAPAEWDFRWSSAARAREEPLATPASVRQRAP